MKIINFKKKENDTLTNIEYESYINQVNYHICKKRFLFKYFHDKTHHEVRDHCTHRGAIVLTKKDSL